MGNHPSSSLAGTTKSFSEKRDTPWALLLSGGGIHGIKIFSAYRFYRDRAPPTPPALIMGCSIGAIGGFLLYLGFEIEDVITTLLACVQKDRAIEVLPCIRDTLVKHVEEKWKFDLRQTTFRELGEKFPCAKVFGCTAWDTAARRITVFSTTDTPDTIALDAVIASASIPGYTTQGPATVNGRQFVDSGSKGNFPIDVAFPRLPSMDTNVLGFTLFDRSHRIPFLSHDVEARITFDVRAKYRGTYRGICLVVHCNLEQMVMIYANEKQVRQMWDCVASECTSIHAVF